MRIAVFQSHPIQYFAPLWQELARRDDVKIKVFYYSQHAVLPTQDSGFGAMFKWDLDLLGGYDYQFLPRQWPTTSPTDCTWKGLNKGLREALDQGWDVTWIAGYVHVNNWHVLRLCRQRGIRVLYFSDSNILARPALWKRAVKCLLIRYFFGKITVFLAAGDLNRDYLFFYGADPSRIVYCPYPIDVARFQSVGIGMGQAERDDLRSHYDLRPDSFVVGFCGKLVPWKRPLDVARATADMPGVQALFVGSGSLESKLKEFPPGKVSISGFVNQSDIPRVMALCDILVLPSEHEPFGLVVTEAQAMGIPVILSDRCGCYGPKSVFRDNESGYLYTCGDVNQLAERICRLKADPDLRMRLGQRGRELSAIQSVPAVADALLGAARLAVALPH